MIIKKAVALMISVFIGSLIIPVNASSSNEDKDLIVWDGTADTSWYDDEETEFHIYSPSELAGMAVLGKAGRTMEGQTFVLENDMSLKDHQWTPIVNFEGSFDGNNHTITGMTIDHQVEDDKSIRSFGLFGRAGTIKNLTLEDVSINLEKDDFSFSIGGIVGSVDSITDCTVSGEIECNIINSSYSVGGIAGSAQGVQRCKANVDINAHSNDMCEGYIGGICGGISETDINECCNYGALSYDGAGKNFYMGGITGVLSTNSEPIAIKNCYNRADLESTNDTYGIVGRIAVFDTKHYNYEISNVYNTGKCDYGIYKSNSYTGALNNAYYSSSCAVKGTDSQNDTTIPKPIANMKKEAFAQSLGDSFIYQADALPVLKWEVKDSPEPTVTTESINTTTTTTKPVTSTTTNKATVATTKATTLSNTTKTEVVSTTKTTVASSTKKAITAKITSYTTKSTTLPPTTTSTTPVTTKVKNKLGDVNGDSIIDSSDASGVLMLYAKLSTGEVDVSENIKAIADVNGDGRVDSSDASLILEYYAAISTGETKTFEEYLSEPLKEPVLVTTTTIKIISTTTITTTKTTATTTTTTEVPTTTIATTTVTETPKNESIYKCDDFVVNYEDLFSDDNYTYIDLYIENITNRDICIQTRDLSINGFMMDATLSEDISAGKKALATIIIKNTEFDKTDIIDIHDIELKIICFDRNDSQYRIVTVPIHIIKTPVAEIIGESFNTLTAVEQKGVRGLITLLDERFVYPDTVILKNCVFKDYGMVSFYIYDLQYLSKSKEVTNAVYGYSVEHKEVVELQGSYDENRPLMEEDGIIEVNASAMNKALQRYYHK